MSRRKSHKLMTLIAGASLVAVAAAGAAQASSAPAASGGGGELVDLGTFALGPPEHIDPALNTTLDAQQVINALYDGLTDIDCERPGQSQGRARPRRLLGQRRRHRVDVHDPPGPGVHRRRADPAEHVPALVGAGVRPDFAGDYAYLINFIEGGAEKLAGDRRHDHRRGGRRRRHDPHGHAVGAVLQLPGSGRLPAVHADARGGGRRRPRLREPADDRQRPVQDGVAAHRRGDRPRQERQLGRRLQRRHVGPAARPASRSGCPSDADTSYNGARGRRGRHRPHPVRVAPPRRWPTGAPPPTPRSWARTTSRSTTATRGSAARRTSSSARRSRRRSTATRSTTPSSTAPAPCRPASRPRASPGFKADLCEYCAYDPDAAQAAFDEWTAAGNVQSEPIPIQYNAGGGHGDVVQLIIDNLAAIGIQAVPDERDTHDVLLGDGRRGVRDLPVRLVRRLPDVRQLHVRPVPHRRRSTATTTATPTRSSTTSWPRPSRPSTRRSRPTLFNQAEACCSTTTSARSR